MSTNAALSIQKDKNPRGLNAHLMQWRRKVELSAQSGGRIRDGDTRGVGGMCPAFVDGPCRCLWCTWNLSNGRLEANTFTSTFVNVTSVQSYSTDTSICSVQLQAGRSCRICPKYVPARVSLCEPLGYDVLAGHLFTTDRAQIAPLSEDRPLTLAREWSGKNEEVMACFSGIHN